MTNRLAKVLIVVSLLLVVTIVWVVALYLQSGSKHGVNQTREAISDPLYDQNEVLSGHVYFSAAKKDSDVMQIFSLDIDDLSSEPQVIGTEAYSYNYDKSGSYSSYIFADNPAEPKEFFIRFSNHADQVLHATGTYKRNPVVAASGDKVAVSVTSPLFKTGDGFDLEKWDIVILDTNSNSSQVVGQGVNPLWGPEDKYLLFLAKDGIKIYDFENQTLSTAVPVSAGQANAQMKIDVSSDGRSIAWAVPSEREMAVFAVTNWSPFEFIEDERISLGDNTGFYWPVFSPGSKYIIAQAVDAINADFGSSTEKKYTNPRFVVYDRSTKTFTDNVYSLINYDFLRLFNDDWEISN